MRHQTLPFRNKVSISLTFFMKKINAQFSIIQNNYLYGKTNFFGLRCLRIQGQLGHFALFPYFWEHQHNGQLDVRSRSQIIYRVWGKYYEVFFFSFSKESWFRSCLISILVPTLVVHSRSDSRPQWTIPKKGTGMKNYIPNFWKWNRNKKFYSQLLGRGMGMKNPFPTFGNGNGRLVFPGMVGNGNSRSPLNYVQRDL